MNINSVKGLNAYSTNTKTPENSRLAEQNQASAQSDLSPKESKTVQQAFEVQISSQGRQQLSAAQAAAAATTQPPETQSLQSRDGDMDDSATQTVRPRTGPIVNIVA